MNESIWARAAAYAFVAIIAVGSWAIAQRVVDEHRIKLPIVAYIDCLEQFGTIDWGAATGSAGESVPPPSGSEVCGELTSREKVD